MPPCWCLRQEYAHGEHARAVKNNEASTETEKPGEGGAASRLVSKKPLRTDAASMESGTAAAASHGILPGTFFKVNLPPWGT